MDQVADPNIALTPETSAHLRSLAARAGELPDAFADALLAEALTDYESTLTGIERGLAAAATGDERDFEAYVAQRQAQRQQRTSAV